MKSEVYSQSTCIVSTAAYQYYIEGKKRSEIAESLGLSPSTLSRVLKRAKEEGIIEIKVTEPFLSCNIMEKEIREKYGLKTVIVVPIPSELRCSWNGMGWYDVLSDSISESLSEG